MTRLLVLSSHSILEFDDLRLFSRLGYDVFMPGGYSNPAQPGETMRPALPDVPYHADLDALCHEQRVRHAGQPTEFGIVDWAKADLHQSIIDWADIIMVNCFPEAWIGHQWDRIREKRVIWRTIGQSNPRLEHEMRQYEGLQIVRYSPAEKRAFEPLGVFAGEDAMIRFGKDAADYGPWTGEDAVVGNVTQNLDVRGDHCGLAFWQAATQGLPTMPAGLGSERLPHGTGTLSWDQLRAYLARIRVMLYMGTEPASYTLGLMEAMLTGTPVVSIGPEHMWMPPLFEGHELVGRTDADGYRMLNGYNLWANKAADARVMVEWLLDPHSDAPYISGEMRRRAIALFSYEAVGPQWLDFLGAPDAMLHEAFATGEAKYAARVAAA